MDAVRWFTLKSIPTGEGEAIRSLQHFSKFILRTGALLFLASLPSFAFLPPVCVANSLPLASIKLFAAPSKGGMPLPITSVNMIQTGDLLKYEPLHLPQNIQDKARIAPVLAPPSGAKKQHIEVLDSKPAKGAAVWKVPIRTSIVGVVFGPHGLDVKKISSMLNKNPDLVSELADYAQKSATVNALVQTLSQYEQSRPGSEDLNAALRGFSSQYGVALPRVDSTMPTDEQATMLLHAVLPSISGYDPMTSSRAAALQQSAGLAASVAALFYGTPVGLAVGGAVLFQNLRTMVFPDTDFRAAFTEPAGEDGMEFCTPKDSSRSHARLAYLWMLRVPDVGPPSASLVKAQDVPLGAEPKIEVTCATQGQLRHLHRARKWQLVSADTHAPVAVKVTPGSTADTLSLNLSDVKIPPGQYQLAALWDWQPFTISGLLSVRSYSDFSAVKPTPESADRLIAGNGKVKVDLVGADFEFVNQIAIESASESHAKPEALFYTLPKGQGKGEQSSIQTEVDTSARPAGTYFLMLTQTNGKTQDVSITIHPPNPTITNTPLRANIGESKEVIELHGTGLARIEGLSGDEVTWTLAPVPDDAQNLTVRKATVRLAPGAQKGQMLSLNMRVKGLFKPIQLSGALQVAGPRPQIVSVRESFPAAENVELRKGEIPAGLAVSFAIDTKNVDAQPSVALACKDDDDTRRDLKLEAGERQGNSQLDYTGNNTLFLSLEPGAVGQSGCVMTASVITPDAGHSTPYPLGRIIRLPQIDKFALSNDRLGANLYSGTITGQNLQMIEMAGWNSRAGYPVRGIPTPLPDNPQEQTLAIELPWPPPAPHAPVYIWLRGETHGRRTSATY